MLITALPDPQDRLFKIVLLTVTTIALLGITGSHTEALTPGHRPLDPSLPAVHDLNGTKITEITAGEQVLIVARFTNIADEEIPFLGVVQVKNESGVTSLLAWQSGTVEPQTRKAVGVSWVVPESSTYQVRAFAISSMQTPDVLAELRTSVFEAS